MSLIYKLPHRWSFRELSDDFFSCTFSFLFLSSFLLEIQAICSDDSFLTSLTLLKLSESNSESFSLPCILRCPLPFILFGLDSTLEAFSLYSISYSSSIYITKGCTFLAYLIPSSAFYCLRTPSDFLGIWK